MWFALAKEFNEDQPRDSAGKWTATGDAPVTEHGKAVEFLGRNHSVRWPPKEMDLANSTGQLRRLSRALDQWSGRGSASNAMSWCAQKEVTGNEMYGEMGLEHEDLIQYQIGGHEILNAIREVPAKEQDVYRGLNNYEKQKLNSLGIEQGDHLCMAGPKSFSHNFKVAFEATPSGYSHYPTMYFHLTGPVKGIDNWNGVPQEEEFITGGRFKVESIVYSSDKRIKTYNLKQVGVY